MNNLTIGFLSSATFDNNVYRGAILVTDCETKPLEFRVTAPVHPTNFQEILYGKVLIEHILVELFTIPLLNSLSQKPDIVVVQDPLFLGANDLQNIPIVRVRVLKDEEVRFSDNNKAERLTPISGKYEPILIETSQKLESRLSEFRKQLLEVFSKRSLLEPFERIKLALKEVHTQKVAE